MRRTTPGILLLLVLAALAAPAAALGQAKGPAALWDAYPLEQAPTTPEATPQTPPAVAVPSPATPPAAAPEPSGDDGIPIWAIIAGALAVVVLGGGIGIFSIARLRRQREPATEGSAALAPEPPRRPDPTPVAEPVAVVAEPAPPRPPDPAPVEAAPVTVATPAPSPEPVPIVATAVEADAEAVALADDLELAELAAEYLWTVATGSRRPVVDLAARRFIRVGRAREMLGRARARGILAGAGRGRPGGALTEKGRGLLETGSRSTGVPAWQEGVLPPVVATPETAPAGPPRLRLAGDEEEGRGPIGSPPEHGVTLDQGEPPGPALTVLEGGARNLS